MALSNPKLDPPKGLKLWELGKRDYWSRLGEWLKNSGAEDMNVMDERSAHHMRQIQRAINESKNPFDCTGLIMALVDDQGGSNAHQLLKRVLSTGANPDLPDSSGRRPSHVAAYLSRTVCFEALLLCRPNLQATSVSLRGSSLMEARPILRHRSAAVGTVDGDRICDFLDKVEQNGFPSIAELAFRKEFWALKNLCRRQVVTSDEIFQQYQGKHAIEWVEHHAELEVIGELRYLLLWPHLATLRQEFASLTNRVAEQEHKFVANQTLPVGVPESNGTSEQSHHPIDSAVSEAQQEQQDSSMLPDERDNTLININQNNGNMNGLPSKIIRNVLLLDERITRLEGHQQARGAEKPQHHSTTDTVYGWQTSAPMSSRQPLSPLQQVGHGLLRQLDDVLMAEKSPGGAIEIIEDLLALVKKLSIDSK